MKLSLQPITVNTPCSISGAIVDVINNTVNNCCVMFANRNNKVPIREFSFAKVDFAPATNEHGWSPLKTNRGHVVFKPFAFDTDAVAGRANFLCMMFRFALSALALCKSVVDLLVRKATCDGNGTGNTIPRYPLVSRFFSASIVKLVVKLSRAMRPLKSVFSDSKFHVMSPLLWVLNHPSSISRDFAFAESSCLDYFDRHPLGATSENPSDSPVVVFGMPVSNWVHFVSPLLIINRPIITNGFLRTPVSRLFTGLKRPFTFLNA